MEHIFQDNDEFLKFDNVPEKKATRPDLHAFIVLAELDPGNRDVLASSGHDEVWLSFDPEVVFSKITEAQALDLVRCGVLYDADYQGFHMFV